MYDAVARAILTDVPARSAEPETATIVAFRAVASTLPMLTDAERALLSEWLAR